MRLRGQWRGQHKIVFYPGGDNVIDICCAGVCYLLFWEESAEEMTETEKTLILLNDITEHKIIKYETSNNKVLCLSAGEASRHQTDCNLYSYCRHFVFMRIYEQLLQLRVLTSPVTGTHRQFGSPVVVHHIQQGVMFSELLDAHDLLKTQTDDAVKTSNTQLIQRNSLWFSV